MDRVLERMSDKILLVDRTRGDRAFAADVLAGMGYSTVEVESRARALKLVEEESPDLILLDATPDAGGLELCRHLKSDPFTRHIPVLVLTAERSVPARVEALRAGADGCLGRPLSAEELVAEVQVLLRRSFQFDPLTKLPAAPYLHRQIDERLARSEPTAVLYFDIDRFGAYNQAYGHLAGDRVLVALAHLLVDVFPTRASLVGHLGSDDFIAVLAPDRADELAVQAVDRFRDSARTFYREADAARGSIAIENRRGDIVEYPLIALSAAITSSATRGLRNYVQVSEILAQVMGYIKSQGGDRWMRDRRAR